MQQNTIVQLKSLLNKLKNGEGYFIIQAINQSKINNADSAFYCQLLKIESQQPIQFEAVSHHQHSSVSPSVESSFKSLGFALQPGENYTKFISLNSEDSIDEDEISI